MQSLLSLEKLVFQMGTALAMQAARTLVNCTSDDCLTIEECSYLKGDCELKDGLCICASYIGRSDGAWDIDEYECYEETYGVTYTPI